MGEGEMGDGGSQARILGFEEALAVVLRHAEGVGPPAAETVELLQSNGRVLAEDVVADRDMPPFDRSTRDGFAVRAAEWSGGRKLRVVGQVRAGEAWGGGVVSSGCAVEIMTGAAVPGGLDAVAMVEHVECADGEVRAAAGPGFAAGENIVARGSEARRGDVLLGAGAVVGSAEIAVGAACGYAKVRVRVRPKVAIVATGDELVEVDEVPGDRQIRNSNGYALAALVEAAGGRAERLGIARDTREGLLTRTGEGQRSDMLLLSGGVSAGKYDLVEEVLGELGAEFLFTGVRMQPGRPVVFGRLPGSESASQRVSESAGERGWTYFFGLPGNPVSTEVTFHCFVEPMLRAMCGGTVAGPRFAQATLAEAVNSKAGLTRLLPAHLSSDLTRPEVRLVGWQGSGDLAANARANCYAVLPDGRDLAAGDVITILLR